MEILRSSRPHANPWFAVREDDLLHGSGRRVRQWLVEAADIALVVPVEGVRIHLVEQYRHPVGARCWELPSGGIEADHDADASRAARRELAEETGLVAGTLTPLGVLDVHPSTLAQRCHVFLATDLRAGPAATEPAEHGLRSAWFDRTEIAAMAADGRLRDAKSLAALALLGAATPVSPSPRPAPWWSAQGARHTADRRGGPLRESAAGESRAPGP